MHPQLEAAAERLSLELPALSRAADHSVRFQQEALSFLRSEAPALDEPVDVVIFGSYAREEASPGSDLDYLVVPHGLAKDVNATRTLRRAVAELLSHEGIAAPGPTNIFGRVVAAPDLTERIGLTDDTNASHSRRVLLMQESASMYRPELHAALLRAIAERYLVDYKKHGVARFLVNDVVRYWRTIAVDYQAKRWEDVMTDQWGLRFLKLIISRKLGFAGTLTSVFLCDPATVDGLIEQFQMPALARLAQLHRHLDSDSDRAALRTALQIAEDFNSALADERFRQEAKAITDRSEIRPDSRFAEFQERARELQEALEHLFFGTAVLSAKSKTYLSF